jgi:hypothetical protein
MAMSVALVSCLTFLVIVYWIGAVFIYMRRRDEEKSTVGGSCCAGTKCGDCSVCRRMCEHVGMFLCGIGLVRTNVGVPFDVREKRGYFVGRLMTAVLLAGTAVLLSPSLMQLFSGGDASAAAAHKSHQSNFLGGGADLCGEGEMEALLAELNAEIDDLMHLSAARQQLNLTRQFGDALQADVSLWGDPGHQCNDLVSHRPVSREQFHGSHPNDGPYFPGWCKEASETALRAARTRTCEATGPEICVFAPLGFCVKTYTPTVTVKCPNHAAASNIETQQEDYRVEQLRFANARAEALDLQQQAMSLALEQGGAKDTAKSIVTRLLYQLDVASNVYIAYTVLGLFFPTPVVLHKTGIFTRIKVSPIDPHNRWNKTNRSIQPLARWLALESFATDRVLCGCHCLAWCVPGLQRTLFGVHKTNFMLLFVAGWWCYDYYYMLLDTPAIQIYLSNLSLNPCYLDGEHMRQRQEMLATSCAELRTMLANFTVASITIEDTLNEVDHFAHNCRCDYPNVALADTPFSCTRCGAPGSERAPVQSNPCCVEGAQPPTLLQDNVSAASHCQPTLLYSILFHSRLVSSRLVSSRLVYGPLVYSHCSHCTDYISI